jgi:hypothetical protein
LQGWKMSRLFWSSRGRLSRLPVPGFINRVRVLKVGEA